MLCQSKNGVTLLVFMIINMTIMAITTRLMTIRSDNCVVFKKHQRIKAKKRGMSPVNMDTFLLYFYLKLNLRYLISTRLSFKKRSWFLTKHASHNHRWEAFNFSIPLLYSLIVPHSLSSQTVLSPS